ncbi:dynein axonemal light chain 1-like [Adelges cooleyi]|uniref:dynein axonemal light chain 1-like n=1 Tax=Adelges cooleyi TaxID=133065 RepID=UPI0021802C57|nr:dynein axonemal light chain 1-like [Adelges cooleyi]
MGDLKATTIKDAIKKWEDDNKESATEAKSIGLQFQWPPIEKMDSSLSVLVNCEKLSLSTNMIEKINGLSALRNLKILSLGRNYIKAFTGLESLADTLEELWISYNFIEKMKGILGMRKLKVLYMSNNSVKEWAEVNKLAEMESLQDLLFVGNPLFEALDESVWRSECIRKLPKLVILDGLPVIRE